MSHFEIIILFATLFFIGYKVDAIYRMIKIVTSTRGDAP